LAGQYLTKPSIISTFWGRWLFLGPTGVAGYVGAVAESQLRRASFNFLSYELDIARYKALKGF
jgi:hypothetical protein